MKKTPFTPEKIYIDNRVKNNQLTQNIINQFPNIAKETIYDTNSFIKTKNKELDALSKGKKVFFLTTNKGKFLKKCPGTKNYICCGYQILHQASQCNLNCSYCILQSYFNNPLITIFTNLDEMMDELDKKIDENPERYWRIGTGEYTDSLAFDHITNLAGKIVPYFKTKKNAILELKSKTTNIDHLLKLDPQGKTITSWSLNAKTINKNEEEGASTITERLEAANLCQEKGYKIAFHFDPIFYFPNWEEEYQHTVSKIFKYVDKKNIVWISLGCFRFIPSLKGIIENRFPKTNFIYKEFIKGLDDKMRYPKPLRIHIYKKMVQWIKKNSPETFVYLCMESKEVWQKSFGYTPKKYGSLAKGLDKQVFQI